ncbi:hypothetical protein Glove_329g47 [Diversispora epigaea]|uniref:LIM interaction domain-containing protein n=1 Tax=Diversispora epigaea TaxID=1348612 RepID=A0A397HKJ8_9GLOM|nr:hypothetical protein Glove_329g47 [Diversispora epigaea]
MANLNPSAYTNGINVPHSIVGIQNAPRMHLVQPQTYNLPVGNFGNLGFPTRIPGQMQIPPNITVNRNMVPYLQRQSGSLGRCTLRIFMFSDRLSCENEPNKLDITHWRRVVEEFFSSDAKMKYVAFNQNDGSNRTFELLYPTISRFFLVNFESGVKSIGFTINHHKESIAIPQGYILDGKASFIYNYEDESKVVAEGKLKVRFNINLKIELFEFITDKHSEYVPRHRPILQESTISEFGIPQKTQRCLEVAEVVSYLNDVITLTFSIDKGPLSALSMLANDQQGVGGVGGGSTMARSNTTPPTPGPSPPEPTAKTPKEKGVETIATDNTNTTANESPVPSPSTSKTESPTTKPMVRSPLLTNKRPTLNDASKTKRQRSNKPARKGSRQDTGS